MSADAATESFVANRAGASDRSCCSVRTTGSTAPVPRAARQRLGNGASNGPSTLLQRHRSGACLRASKNPSSVRSCQEVSTAPYHQGTLPSFRRTKTLTLNLFRLINLIENHTMRLFVRKPASPPTVPTDSIIPVSYGDDDEHTNGLSFDITWRFENVLDAAKLRVALSRLLEIGDWRKLGARLRRNVRCSEEFPKKLLYLRPILRMLESWIIMFWLALTRSATASSTNRFTMKRLLQLLDAAKRLLRTKWRPSARKAA